MRALEPWELEKLVRAGREPGAPSEETTAFKGRAEEVKVPETKSQPGPGGSILGRKGKRGDGGWWKTATMCPKYPALTSCGCLHVLLFTSHNSSVR